ncbi:MAG: LytR C-terminal domain-containing protein [Acidimicrobiia bacterium]|jgi:hypothetical protein
MTNKGKHATQTPGTFYRDLAIMILGIIVVGALVFFILYLIADQPSTGPTTTTTTLAPTTTTEEATTTVQQTTTSSAPTTTVVVTRPPEQVAVVVLNSVGIDGAAGRFSSELSEAGYQTLTPSNYVPEVAPSRIWFREGFAAEAAVLLELIPDAMVEELPDDTVGQGADVVIVLGTGYSE